MRPTDCWWVWASKADAQTTFTPKNLPVKMLIPKQATYHIILDICSIMFLLPPSLQSMFPSPTILPLLFLNQNQSISVRRWHLPHRWPLDGCRCCFDALPSPAAKCGPPWRSLRPGRAGDEAPGLAAWGVSQTAGVLRFFFEKNKEVRFVVVKKLRFLMSNSLRGVNFWLFCGI